MNDRLRLRWAARLREAKMDRSAIWDDMVKAKVTLEGLEIDLEEKDTLISFYMKELRIEP